MKLNKILSLALLCVGASCFMASSDVSANNRINSSNKNYESMFGKKLSSIEKTDPELFATFKRYVYGDIVEQSTILSDTERELVRIASIATIGSSNMLKHEVTGALNIGVKPLEIRETIYQITPYIGCAKAFDALEVITDVFKDKGIKTPLENQSTVTEETRFDKGLEVQIGIFGEHINQMRSNAPADAAHFNDDLAAFCFGDTYTRGTLDLQMRELLTFSAIASLGGCEPQLKGHIVGNKSVGNSREKIIGALTAINPFIGFPRTLNALACINEAFPNK